MTQYHPTINCAAHSLDWLQNRRNVLARLGLSGSLNEKKSLHRKAELAAIDAGLRARGTAPVQLPRARVLPDSGAADVARAQPVWPPMTLPRPTGVRGYSAAVQNVASDYNPPKNHLYA